VITTVTNNQTNVTSSTDINGNPNEYPWFDQINGWGKKKGWKRPDDAPNRIPTNDDVDQPPPPAAQQQPQWNNKAAPTTAPAWNDRKAAQPPSDPNWKTPTQRANATHDEWGQAHTKGAPVQQANATHDAWGQAHKSKEAADQWKAVADQDAANAAAGKAASTPADWNKPTTTTVAPITGVENGAGAGNTQWNNAPQRVTTTDGSGWQTATSRAPSQKPQEPDITQPQPAATSPSTPDDKDLDDAIIDAPVMANAAAAVSPPMQGADDHTQDGPGPEPSLDLAGSAHMSHPLVSEQSIDEAEGGSPTRCLGSPQILFLGTSALLATMRA